MISAFRLWWVKTGSNPNALILLDNPLLLQIFPSLDQQVFAADVGLL
jgi:hypothetical protein